MKALGSHLMVERPGAAVRVLFFHHAGGSAMSCLPLARELPANCEPLLFELPGRGMRHAEPPAADYAAAVATLAPAVAEAIDRPTVLFGHSLGAIMAHGVLCALPPERQALVRAVVVSAFTAPHRAAGAATHPEKPFVVRSREDLFGELVGRGGCAPELFAEPDLVAIAVDLLGADLHLADTYVEPPSPVADIDYHVWHGRDDAYVTEDGLADWRLSTPRPPAVRDFRGGHFYLDQTAEAKVALRELLESLTSIDELGEVTSC